GKVLDRRYRDFAEPLENTPDSTSRQLSSGEIKDIATRVSDVIVKVDYKDGDKARAVFHVAPQQDPQGQEQGGRATPKTVRFDVPKDLDATSAAGDVAPHLQTIILNAQEEVTSKKRWTRLRTLVLEVGSVVGKITQE
ncbi:unnamed protein product, partial [Amoebophrya sp. A25]